MIRLFFAAALFLSLAPFESVAASFDPPQGIISKERFPQKELNFVRTESGRTYLISSDGRYVFQGELFDVWNGERIDSLEKYRRLSERVDMEYLGIEPSRMFSLDIGSGEKEAYMFVDPGCSYCQNLLKDAAASEQIRSDFKIKVIPVSLLSENSLEKNKKIATLADDSEELALKALLEHSFADLEAADGSFPRLKYNLLVATALSIKNVPYLVNPNGFIHIGVPQDMRSFLEKE
ncbi:MAG: hypothetical protein ACLFSY_01750 [Desulfonatronovibrionaceae bacterium]